MKDVDKLLNNMNNCTSLENEQPLGSEEKKRIMEMTMKKINEESKRDSSKRRFIKKRICTAVIGAALVFSTVGVSAGVIFNWNDKLSKQLEVKTDQKQELIPSGMEINKSVTENGLTLTAVQSVGDKYGVYILFDIEAPEEVNLSTEDNFFQIRMHIDGVVTSSAQYSIIEADGNKATLLLNISTPEGNISGSNIDFEMIDLCHKEQIAEEDYDEQAAEADEYYGFTKIIDGEWHLSWTLNYNDISKDYEVNRYLNIYDGEAIWESVNVSPLSATITLSENKPFTVHSKDNPWDTGRGVIIKLKNGEIIDKDNCGTVSDGLTVITISFGRVIDVNDIESISFDGEEFKL